MAVHYGGADSEPTILHSLGLVPLARPRLHAVLTKVETTAGAREGVHKFTGVKYVSDVFVIIV